MARISRRLSASVLTALFSGTVLIFAGCSSDEESGGGGTGGAATGGTHSGTGGKTATLNVGGAATGGTRSGTGGTTAALNVGGTVATGGASIGTGGTTAVMNVGGAVATGGVGSSLGGTVGIGGSVGIGGTTGTGGVSDIDSGLDSGLDSPLHVYVGCADTTGTVEIYSLDTATAALSPLSTFMAGGALSNAEWNDAQDRLYIAHMIGTEANLSTLTRNATSGALATVGTPVAVPFTPPEMGSIDGGTDAGVTTGNAGPQTLTFDRTRHFLTVPNYFSGYTYVYDMATDGTVGSLVSWHTAGANAHHAVFTLNNKFILVPYLGANLIETYAFNDTTGAITPSSSTPLPAANSGPRHVALHANGKWLYSINETAGGDTTTSGTIDMFTVDQTVGTVTSVATFTVPLPTGYTGLKKNGSEIEIAPEGDLLFVSMRLDNTAPGNLVSYRIDPTTGALTLIEQESSSGVTPRQFSLSADGNLLLVGNQNSDTIAIFRVDPATGNMTFVEDHDVCHSPRFVKMAPALK